MMIGVLLVLSAVALAAVLFRRQLLRLLAARLRVVEAVTRTIQVTAGLILAAVAWNAITG
jgi:ABC-type nickel/cobalt efflux system permease component RcnA